MNGRKPKIGDEIIIVPYRETLELTEELFDNFHLGFFQAWFEEEENKEKPVKVIGVYDNYIETDIGKGITGLNIKVYYSWIAYYRFPGEDKRIYERGG